MDQNKENIGFEEAKQYARSMVEKKEREAETQRSVFETFMQKMSSINPTVNDFEELGLILSLPEEQFALIGPIFLNELEKAMTDINSKLILIQAMNASDVKLEDLRQAYSELSNYIDAEFVSILSGQKRDFLKRLLNITYNCIAGAEGVAKKVVQIPIELVSENAKIPTYAHLGDGAVDLYSPADYTINPGETVIIPCDIKVALPYGYAFLIHPRSGTSAKTKLRVANSIGLVDSQYKGVIGVIIENIESPIKDITYEFDDSGRPILTSVLHGQSYTISKGERFAQMRLVEVPTANFFQVESVDGIGDDRGGGFGSSGTN